ncbi:phage tail assembly chaperone [Bradyrhizobium sp. PMVTL-01]|uniref:phage tail assembly chaperone n=1 Tax=Bradyrhizobium sp. PMVTL-01 TaxID=3434999 RepID=UPI003F71A8A3
MFGIRPKGGVTSEPAPRFPRLLRHVWDAFCEIAGGIQGNGWSHPVITWQSLEAWSAATGQRLEPHEARVVIRLGQRRAAILNAAQAKKNAGKN